MWRRFLAGLTRRALGLVFGLLLLAGGASAAVQAGGPPTFPARLPLLMQGPGPIYLPIIGKGPPPATIDLAVSRIEIIQGVTMSPAYTVQVAGRPALVRVFVGLTGAGLQGGVTGRLTRYLGAAAQDSLAAGPITVLANTSQSSLAETLNFNLPGSWLSPGTAYVFQLDPANAIPETNETNNRYPPAGQTAFNFQNAPTLDVVIVPVHYARSGAPASDPPTNDLSYLTWLPLKVYPLAQINYSVHSPFVFTGDLSDPSGQGWEQLLNSITTIHTTEDLAEHQEYVGLVDSVAADGCNGGCIAGIGWINQPNGGFASKTAVGFAGFANNRNEASPIMTHEMGHNFGRYHSPCGTTASLGPYPYPGAALGQWGYDNASGQLKDPNVYRDFMSYCSPAWTSDFTYQALFNAWSWVSRPFGTAAVTDQTSAWVISGSYDQADHWTVGPAHVQPVLPNQLSSSGPLRLEILNASGQVLTTQPFASVTMALDTFRTGFYRQGFRVAVPVVPGAAGFRITRDGQMLYERLTAGPAPRLGAAAASAPSSDTAGLSWGLLSGAAGVTYRVRLSLDGGQTWQLLALDQPEPSVALPAAQLKGASQPLLEVQASDGVRTDTHTYPLSRP